MPSVRRYAARLPGVVYAADNLYTCSQDTQRHIAEMIDRHRLNRVVVAACTPRTHEPLFQATLRAAGLNRSLFEMANIRDQCSWVHMNEPEAATEKAKDLVRMAVTKAAYLVPLAEQSLPVTGSALVIGGGVAGITAALTVADQGYECVLVERGKDLGGQALKLTADRNGQDPREKVAALIRQVEGHPRIRVLKRAEVSLISGYVGNFTSTVATDSGNQSVKHGVTVLATGGHPYCPGGRYLYGKSPRVMTQLELEARLASDDPLPPDAGQVVMIQCVGSRGEDLAYCSRVCCGQALKNAIRLKRARPGLGVVILYRDMRAYGFLEDDYQEARRMGVIFLRYSPERPPRVLEEEDRGGTLTVRAWDPLIGEDVEFRTDMLVLSVGVVPEDQRDLAGMLKVPVTEDGFLLEAHVKLRPVDLPVDGVYVCGLAHSPRSIDESIAQAQAAAARACRSLARGSIVPEPIVSSVDEEKCVGCGACERFCPYKAIRLHKEGKKCKARTITASCKGCGICASRCPTMAIDMGRFTCEGIMAQIHAFSEREETNGNQ